MPKKGNHPFFHWIPWKKKTNSHFNEFRQRVLIHSYLAEMTECLFDDGSRNGSGENFCSGFLHCICSFKKDIKFFKQFLL